MFQSARDLSQISDLQAQLEEATKEKQEIQEKVQGSIQNHRSRLPGSSMLPPHDSLIRAQLSDRLSVIIGRKKRKRKAKSFIYVAAFSSKLQCDLHLNGRNQQRF